MNRRGLKAASKKSHSAVSWHLAVSSKKVTSARAALRASRRQKPIPDQLACHDSERETDDIEARRCNRRCGFGDSQIFAASPFSPLASNLNNSPQSGSRNTGFGRKRFVRNSIFLPADQCQRVDQYRPRYARLHAASQMAHLAKSQISATAPFDDAVNGY
jgi:hypothetical protein